MFDLTNKKTVITGGGSGIGKAISILFAKQGADVYIIELDNKAGDETVKEITDLGGIAKVFSCNVSDQNSVKQIFEEIGTINILINNAGISHVGNLEKTLEADFDKLFQVNVKGIYNCMYAVVPLMKQNGGGIILNMSSIAALVGIPDRFAYSMTKGAVSSMTMSVARDYLSDNIRCNSISPSRVHTPFVDGFINKYYTGNEDEMFKKLSKSQPIGRMGKPEEVASLALFLCSDEASFITGCDYPIDGGFTKLIM